MTEQIDKGARAESRSEADDIDLERQESVQEMIASSFRGQARWLTLFAAMKITGCVAIIVVSTVAFFNVDSTRAMIAWGAVFVAACTGSVMWWMWYWMLLQRNSQTREIKRLEVQVARLVAARS